MRRFRLFKAVNVLAIVCVAIVVFGYVTMLLWNAVVPAIFGLKAITFVQALGLLVLGRILFGGFHRRGGGPGWGRRGWGRGWRDKWEARWAAMSEEERERFRAGMRGRRCGGVGRESEAAAEQKAV